MMTPSWGSSKEDLKAMKNGEDTGKYPYKDLPLTPAIVEDLIQQLFPSGTTVERSAIVEKVLATHLAAGGKKPKADINHSVKKALNNLQSKHLVENATIGWWRIVPAVPPDLSPEPPQAEGVSSGVLQTESPQEENDANQGLPERIADLVLGSGDAAVYLYYLPSYRILAEQLGKKTWPCKIGRTERDPLSRILSQAATALPEIPHVALVVRTQYPVALESALHGVLTLRGLKIAGIPGSESFTTSPDEVIDLVRLFDPDLE
jgi:hypothetical protein